MLVDVRDRWLNPLLASRIRGRLQLWWPFAEVCATARPITVEMISNVDSCNVATGAGKSSLLNAILDGKLPFLDNY